MIATEAAMDFHQKNLECERDDVYLPSPEEIRELCAEIQAGWTEAERARRARGQAGRQRTVPVSAKRFARLVLDRNHRDGWAA